MGFRSDQEGILRRFIREKENWSAHLSRTRAFIMGCFADRQDEEVAVLGSGWLLDVPLDELSPRYRRIWLVDVIHPPRVRKKAAGLKNVELVTTDLTGGAIQQAWDFVHHSKRSGNQKRRENYQFIETMRLSPPLQGSSPPLAISVNLLNQLDILICDYLSGKGGFAEELLPPIRARIQQHHLDWITIRPGCLVADVREINTDRMGRTEERNLVYASLPEGIRSEEWIWHFDTRQTYREGRKTDLRVKAVEWR